MSREPIDIIVITMSRWDGVFSSAIFSLAKELSRNNRVFYIDHPFSLKDLWSDWSDPAVQRRKYELLRFKTAYHKVPGLEEDFTAVTPKVTFPINFLGNNGFYEFGSKLNDKFLNASLASVIKDHGIKKYMFLNSFDPFFFRTITVPLKPAFRVYQSRDDISQESYVARHGIRLEKEQIRNSDLSIGTSMELCRKLSTPDYPVNYLPNAADVDLFAKAANNLDRPTDLPNDGKAIIGYTGNISTLRINFDLLKAVARAHQDKHLVFIGKKKYADRELENMPNVWFLDPKPLNELPSYLKYIDCCIIPFKKNTLTLSIYPLKLNEYLAAGKPVISTNFSEDIAAFSDVAYLSTDIDNFVELIDKALAENSDALQTIRRNRAGENSWKKRVNQFWALVDQHKKSEALWK